MEGHGKKLKIDIKFLPWATEPVEVPLAKIANSRIGVRLHRDRDFGLDSGSGTNNGLSGLVASTHEGPKVL